MDRPCLMLDELGLAVGDDHPTEVDIDYSHTVFKTDHLAVMFRMGFYTAVHQAPDFRGELPYSSDTHNILFLAQGPGLLYVAVPKRSVVAEFDNPGSANEFNDDEDLALLKSALTAKVFGCGGPILRPNVAVHFRMLFWSLALTPSAGCASAPKSHSMTWKLGTSVLRPPPTTSRLRRRRHPGRMVTLGSISNVTSTT